jgi:hypothetical protein
MRYNFYQVLGEEAGEGYMTPFPYLKRIAPVGKKGRYFMKLLDFMAYWGQNCRQGKQL